MTGGRFDIAEVARFYGFSVTAKVTNREFSFIIARTSRGWYDPRVAIFYCPECRSTVDEYRRTLASGPLYQSEYQKAKQQKHTVVSTSEALQSVFADPSSAAIRPFVERALSNGPVEIDDLGRVNFYSTSTGIAGSLHQAGALVDPHQNAVKVVLSTSTDFRHEFPVSISSISHVICHRCRRLVFGAGQTITTTGD
jgi:hypothetical protein